VAKAVSSGIALAERNRWYAAAGLIDSSSC